MMIKVCGITRREDALEAADAGASAIGFIFYPKSPRYISPEKAREVGEGIEALKSGILKVGVFVDETPASIGAVVRTASLDVAQIYSGRAPQGTRAWLAFRLPLESLDLAEMDIVESVMALEEAADSFRAEAILLDGPGKGASFDWQLARDWSASGGAPSKIIIAGGLDASNVAEAIRIAEPWGVDASSRLESSPGVKDHTKMRQFIKAARGAGQWSEPDSAREAS
jgi:phosphoribosylanthranilate isomerase